MDLRDARPRAGRSPCPSTPRPRACRGRASRCAKTSSAAFAAQPVGDAPHVVLGGRLAERGGTGPRGGSPPPARRRAAAGRSGWSARPSTKSLRRRHAGEQAALDPLQRHAPAGLVRALLLGGDLEREDLAEEVAGGPDLERHGAAASLLWQEIRPQSSPSRRIEIDIEAAVPMLRMYSRWTGETLRRTAKLRSSGRPVSGLRAGTIGTGRVAGVGDQPQPVAPVELARLGGDVGGGEAQVEVGRQGLVAVLGDHRAVPALVEPVDQHPVEAGDRAHLAGGERAEILDAGCRLQPEREAADQRLERVVEVAFRLDHLLQLEDERPSARWTTAVSAGTVPSGEGGRRSWSAPCSGVRRDSSPQASVPAGGSSSSSRAPSTRSTDLPSSGPRWRWPARPRARRATGQSRTPCGWMLPGMRIGSRSQAVRSGGCKLQVRGQAPSLR